MQKSDVGRTFRRYMVVTDRPVLDKLARAGRDDEDELLPYWSTLASEATGARALFQRESGRRIKEPSERVVKVELRVIAPEEGEVL